MGSNWEEDLVAIYSQLEMDHNNWDVWGILADCYEDMGYPHMDALRWLIANERRPYKETHPTYIEARNGQPFLWFGNDCSTRLWIDRYYQSNLPLEMWGWVQLPQFGESPAMRWGLLRECVEAACLAFEKAGVRQIKDLYPKISRQSL